MSLPAASTGPMVANSAAYIVTEVLIKYVFQPGYFYQKAKIQSWIWPQQDCWSEDTDTAWRTVYQWCGGAKWLDFCHLSGPIARLGAACGTWCSFVLCMSLLHEPLLAWGVAGYMSPCRACWGVRHQSISLLPRAVAVVTGYLRFVSLCLQPDFAGLLHELRC